MKKSKLLIAIDYENAIEVVTVESQGTPIEMLGFIARMRHELNKIEGNVFKHIDKTGFKP